MSGNIYGPSQIRTEKWTGACALRQSFSTSLAGHLIIVKPLRRPEPAQEKWFKPNHLYTYM